MGVTSIPSASCDTLRPGQKSTSRWVHTVVHLQTAASAAVFKPKQMLQDPERHTIRWLDAGCFNLSAYPATSKATRWARPPKTFRRLSQQRTLRFLWFSLHIKQQVASQGHATERREILQRSIARFCDGASRDFATEQRDIQIPMSAHLGLREELVEPLHFSGCPCGSPELIAGQL